MGHVVIQPKHVGLVAADDRTSGTPFLLRS